jgi:hypothetical protein
MPVAHAADSAGHRDTRRGTRQPRGMPLRRDMLLHRGMHPRRLHQKGSPVALYLHSEREAR